MADDPGHGARRRRAASVTPKPSSTAIAGSGTRRSSAMVSGGARALMASGDRAGRPGRGLGAQLAGLARRGVEHHHCRRRARPGEHPVQGRRGRLRAGAQRRPVLFTVRGFLDTDYPALLAESGADLPALAHTILVSPASPTTPPSRGTSSSRVATASARTSSTPASPPSGPTTRATSCSRRAPPAPPRVW